MSKELGFSKTCCEISVNGQIPIIQKFSQYYNSSLFEQIAKSKISAQNGTGEIISPDEAEIFRDWYPCELAIGNSRDCNFFPSQNDVFAWKTVYFQEDTTKE